jgi:hypothetical protein
MAGIAVASVAIAAGGAFARGRAPTRPRSHPPMRRASPTPSPVPDAWREPAMVATAEVPLVEPALIADPSHALHLFFADGHSAESQTTALRYAHWSDGHWSDAPPLRALAGDDRVAHPTVALDAHGWLHVLYGSRVWGRIAYTRVHLSEIDDPHAWRQRRILSASSGLHAALATAPEQFVYAAYASHDHHVAFQGSADGGRSWSEAAVLSQLDPDVEACDDPHVVVDASGRIHVAWTQFALPRAWPPTGVFYARSDDHGRTWIPPRRLAGEGHGEITLAVDGDTVHAVWTDTDSNDRRHTWSVDGGGTWAPPAAVGAGVRGAASRGVRLAFDSAGVLHLIAPTGGPGSGEPVVHTAWNGRTWSAAEPVSRVTGPRIVGFPAMAITGGNELHVVYEDDAHRLWERARAVDAPARAAQPLPPPARDVWTWIADTSTALRILAAVLALLALDAAVRPLIRRWRTRT